jgi:putative NADH-flavin reductase
MELAVFGATGGTGRETVREALDADHEVRAFVRDRTKIERDRLEDDRLAAIEGDVLDFEAVERAIEGTDAVLSALGHAEGSPDDVLARGGANIVAAMKEHGVPRLVLLVGAGVRHSDDPFSLGGWAMAAVLRIAGGDLLDDSKAFVSEAVDSDLEWVIVRPPRLTDGKKRGDYRTGYLKLGPRDTVSRADLGAFMVAQAATDTYVGEAPMIAY